MFHFTSGIEIWFHYCSLIWLTTTRLPADTQLLVQICQTVRNVKPTVHFTRKFNMWSRNDWFLSQKNDEFTKLKWSGEKVCHALMFIYTRVNNKVSKWSLFFFLATLWNVLQVSFQRHMCEPVQRDLTRALQGEGNKTQRDEANILILLS